jgi:hypothetical protein
MNQQDLNKILSDHKEWLNDRSEGKRADLTRANLDFSCWPLWCGSKGVKVDKRIACQLIAHVCVLDCDDPEVKKAQKYLMKLARQSHRAKELGLVKP